MAQRPSMALATRTSAPCCPASLCTARHTVQPFSFGSKRPLRIARRQRRSTQAKQTQDEGGNYQLPAIFKIANGVASSAASLVPASVPRPVAKLGVVGVGSLVALWLFGKVVSTVFTVAAVGGAIFLLLKSRGGSTETSQDNGDDSIDPLASARRIMDKYK